MSTSPVIRSITPLDGPWTGRDPFLFMAHHLDAYPAGDGALAPASGREGRAQGADFSGRDGWSMYHGGPVPGFPAHPHRGFETITIVSEGYVDHADSVGGRARYGMGDVQWLTAGAGVLHSEMFPLLHADRGNPLDLVQIWLNLPAARKMARPHFAMFWGERLPLVRPAAGVDVQVIAGALHGVEALAPPPDSWAADPRSELAVWLATLSAGATWRLPPTRAHDMTRVLHVLAGDGLQVAGRDVRVRSAVDLRPDAGVEISNPGPAAARVLLLQARPIAEPVSAHGPFVMNTPAEVQQAFADFQRTRFGRWPFATPAPTHGGEARRFAVFGDGREERPA